ncbi:MAG TPA: glycosyltransferase family 2 protein, partial [Desulfobacterales bacterium]|nr:glycosyltransferase family 2 protein [Desulfobacterales bacterium]
MRLNKKKLSIAIITHNEEERLPDCLHSAAFADEVVVVDSGSTDRTLEIAESFGAKVFNESWRGFGAQKQFAIEQCAGDFILLLDADERLPPETAAEIKDILNAASCEAYSLPRKNYFLNRWIRHAGWWPDRSTRLFKRGNASMPPQLVHESLRVQGRTGELACPIIHYPFRDISQMMLKMDKYSTAGALELHSKGVGSSYSKAVFRAA